MMKKSLKITKGLFFCKHRRKADRILMMLLSTYIKFELGNFYYTNKIHTC